MIASLPLLLALLALPDRPLPEERQLLTRRLETLRRILPDGPNLPADVAHVKALADVSKLGDVDAMARPPAEATSLGVVAVDVTATGRFLDIERFFRQVALSPRLIDVESLNLVGANGGLVRLTTVLRLPFRAVGALLPPPPDGTRQKANGATKAIADGFVRDQALAVAKAEAIVAWRRSRRNPRVFLAELASAVRDRPVVVRQATLATDLRISGVAVGEATVRGLEARLERGFFRVSDFTVARKGACHHFELRGTSPIVGSEAELPMPSEDPFAQGDTPCLVDRDPARTITLKGPKPNANAQGALSLRLREIDATDFVQVLSQLTGQAFVVDSDVAGRVSGDLSRVSLDEALDALAEAGFTVSPPGAVRRVSAGRAAPKREVPPRKAGASGKSAAGRGPSVGFGASTPGGAAIAEVAAAQVARVRLALKRADVRDILATLAEVDPGYAALGPQGSLGRMSLWVPDLPLSEVWAAVTQAGQLKERFEEGRRLLERNPDGAEVLLPVTAVTPDAPRLALQPAELTIGELGLVAVATATDGWRAYAYTPTGSLVTYRKGDRLADGVISAVESTDVTLSTEEGPVRVLLPLR